MIRQQISISLRATAVTLVLTGILYPVLTTGVANVLFPARAQGSFVADERGKVVGSELIGQAFIGEAYLSARPSAAGEKGWDAAGSGGSNLGPTSKALRERAAKDLDRLLHDNPAATGEVPMELVATSASGLDPHVSPQAALWQAPRIAAARGISEDRVRSIIEGRVEGRDLFVLGEPRVNVLLVNLALDRSFGRPPRIAGK
ncbi:MAG TPA: potassium-transporting ATPase subunit KdpC [Myxococcales bacterium]|nr:potassium-transporting ATPase subunit KdpC [Myxococcales bacterium]